MYFRDWKILGRENLNEKMKNGKTSNGEELVIDSVYTYVYTLLMKIKSTITKISKWGNGYGVRIPAGMLAVYQVTAGSEVLLTHEENGIAITRLTPSLADLSLEEIMRDVTPAMLKNDGAETAFGAAQGEEIW